MHKLIMIGYFIKTLRLKNAIGQLIVYFCLEISSVQIRAN